MSDSSRPKPPSGSDPGHARERDDELDFESDALLDSLLFEEAKSTLPPTPKSFKLHEPVKREYSEDDVTVVGRTDELLANFAHDDGTSGLEELANSDIAQLLSSFPPSAASSEQGITPAPSAPLPQVPPAPRPPAIPRPAARGATTTQPRFDGTAKPPAVNPAGLPPRQPFPPAVSPRPPLYRPQPAPPAPPAPPQARSTQPSNPFAGTAEDEEQTRFFRAPSVAQPPLARDSDAELLEPPGAPSTPPSSVPPEDPHDAQSQLPTLSVAAPDEPRTMPPIPRAEPWSADRLDPISIAPGSAATSDSAHWPSSVPAAQPSQPPPIWPDERPARDHLSGQRDTWVARAEWFENEAAASSDVQTKARLLIVASELWALLGELPRARQLAAEASAGPRAHGMALRQQRALAAADNDFEAVTPALELEIRAAPTENARVHAAYLSAEVHRLALHDDATAKKKLDLAMRADPHDPRAHLAKLSEQLGNSNAAPRLRWPDAAALRELSAASDELSRLRGAPGSAGQASETPLGAFDAARRALSSGDRERAAEALDRLAHVEELGLPALWLAASLRAQDGKTRERAISALSELVQRSESRLARRALVTRALEQGDVSPVARAIAGAQGEQTFSAAERLALAALTSTLPNTLESAVWETAGDAELRPLAAAFVAGSPNSTLEVPIGSEAARAEQRLGRALVSPASEPRGVEALREEARAFEATHPMSALARLLSLEFAKLTRASGEIAGAFAEWPNASHSSERARDQGLAAALIHELGREQSSATRMYQRVLEHDPSSEAALRAYSSAVPARASELLLQLADRVGPSPRAALALLEAALRQSGADEAIYVALLERARSIDPELPLSYRLAETAARRSGDTAALLEILRAKRVASDDPVEQALDLVREALLASETDLGLTEHLLEEAQRAAPTDLGLRQLSERLAPGSSADRATFRESLAETSSEPLRSELLAQAALERGRAGESEAAARDAHFAAENSTNPLWRMLAEHYALGGPASARISEPLLERARKTSDPREQRELYERLSEIDRARGDDSSALLWQTAILEQSPQHLPALRRLEHAYLTLDRLDELEPIAAALAKLLDADEADAHAQLATRLRVRRGAWSDTRELAEIALAHSDSKLWALRTLSAQARAQEDNELAFRVEQRLFDLSTRPLDKATLALRAAEAAARLERPGETQRLLAAALEQIPDHLLALTTLAEVLQASQDFAGAAEALERVAKTSRVSAHQVSAWHEAAVLWLDRVDNPERGRTALERAVAQDLSHEEAVARLQTLYVAGNERQKLAELLERRLERTSDPEERIAIEVTRGRALAEVGEHEAARAALAAALDANPDHIEALEAFADLCLAEGDWISGERALIRLALHVVEVTRQAQIYRRLGELYDTALPNPERAELAYKEVLKRDPDDADAVARLVQVYGRMGDKEAALALQSELLARAKTAQEKRERTLALALIEESIGADRRRAEATFDKARKEWPHDSAVLRALVEFHRRNGEARASQVLLDRAASDARRALATGRFEAGFFEVLATVAELKNATDAALVARATLAALYGEEIALPAAGPACGDARLDELLAPELVSPPLRALLRKSGALLDAAYPLDLRALRASPLPVASAAFTSYVQQVASSFGIRGLEVLASPQLGPICVPVSSSPPQIIFGQSLLDSADDAARYFLLIRSLKLLQGHAAALSRTSAIELWPVLAAHLSLFAPNWIPQGVDGKKLADAQRRIRSAMPAQLDDDVPVLALEVIGAIGNRASLLGTALHQWGNRTALLSAGSLTASLRGVALASGLVAGPPKEGEARIKWIVRNPEARDLATFGVSEQYAEARVRLGLAR